MEIDNILNQEKLTNERENISNLIDMLDEKRKQQITSTEDAEKRNPKVENRKQRSSRRK